MLSAIITNENYFHGILTEFSETLHPCIVSLFTKVSRMKNINDLVNSQLTSSIKTNDKLSEFVYDLLHLNKEKHKLWAISKQQQLTLLTDNPYLATQINYQKENICNELNRQFLLNLKSVKIKIIPPTGSKEKTIEDRFIMTKKTAGILKDIAQDIKDDELRELLVNLSKNGR